VTRPEASLGAKVDVPTIDGRAQLKIPPGTQSGQKLRMRERGVESSQHPGKRGDQIVTIEVTVPKLSDERSREIMRELAKLNNQDPRVALFDSVKLESVISQFSGVLECLGVKMRNGEISSLMKKCQVLSGTLSKPLQI
jgi:DnaJ-class molecular chaperone